MNIDAIHPELARRGVRVRDIFDSHDGTFRCFTARNPDGPGTPTATALILSTVETATNTKRRTPNRPALLFLPFVHPSAGLFFRQVPEERQFELFTGVGFEDEKQPQHQCQKTNDRLQNPSDERDESQNRVDDEQN